MNCDLCREALSARVDGEQEPVSPDAVDRHLAGCALCRSWQAKAERLRRSTTLHSAPAVPDLTATILRRAELPARRPWVLRVVLGAVAVAQSTLGGAQLLGLANGMHGGHDTGFMFGHLTRESAAWNLAVGIGLGWAALRPRVAAGQLPVLTGFVLVLAGASVTDLLGEAVTVRRVLSHGLVVVGLVLLYLVYRQHRRHGRPSPVSGEALPGGEHLAAADGAEWEHVDPESGGHRRFPRPASRHRVA
ncbi:zf-HC2 domain-containing protein [Amycolatopsis cihanbeyliensis]|uniref:Putative anti-sigma-YlaC factor YlaD n=1 Tax=Amycolatopsis cihanbeyliensis TaxID=1128664 RepID=A0A542DNH4_AMYCI|nr:zf-HC2 domain-containing protein [Amycolatopsis cihanbeyliensis]TQJ04607.1 putative anti-sigma-YlaC factor YlaD [Amycolatopsis cihanbeyliensis]